MMMTDSPQTTQESTSSILAREAVHNSGLWQPDTVFVRGDGIYLWDADGRRYYDCLAGIAVASLGHAHPRLTRAISAQAAKLIVCPQNLGNDVRTDFVDELFRFVHAPLERVFFANSGSEVNEAALKWARAATGRSQFVGAKRGFSGRTLGVLPLTWEPKYREPFEPLTQEAAFITYNDVTSLDAAITSETAAVILEPIQGEGGVHEATAEFYAAARRLTRERGALLIIDEIQSGAGRTGTFLAVEKFIDSPEDAPDLVTMAKGLGGGVPIGALLMTDSVAKSMPVGGHGTTFGGNPLAAAAGLAVLTEMREAGLLQHVTEAGAYFREQLLNLNSPHVRSVRGRGLLLGLELKGKAAPVISRLRELGVLTINAGATVIRLLPPLIISQREIDEIVTLIGVALQAADPA
jgi:acetylornithine/LysW-gamma-L-lysine aminotransferase